MSPFSLIFLTFFPPQKAFYSKHRILMQTFCVKKKFLLAPALPECQQVIGHTGNLFATKVTEVTFLRVVYSFTFLTFLFLEISKPINLQTSLHLFLK